MVIYIQESPPLRRIYSFLRRPLIASLVTTIIYFVIFLTVLHPGYETNDDISIISLASGYLGGKPLPFLVFSNVLWGFLLDPLYSMHSWINWEILLFFVLNFISASGLIYLVLSRPCRNIPKLFGVLVILLADAYFLVYINFTTMAAFASISGFCLQLEGIKARFRLKKVLFVLGSGLVLAGSYIRIEAMLLALALVLPPLVFCTGSFELKKMTLALAVTGGLVTGSYVFDRLYVQAFPEWNSYYLYDNTRSMLHDTPRLANISTLYQKVGWSQNDLVMFTHWFFPDEKTYSLEHLQVLVNIVPNTHTSLFITLRIFLGSLLEPTSIPYLMMIAAIWVAAWVYGARKRTLLPLLTVSAISLCMGMYLAWFMKLPSRALLSLLAALCIYSMFIFDWTGLFGQQGLSPSIRNDSFSRYAKYFIGLLMLAAVCLVTFQSIQAARLHIIRQAAYERILADLEDLQEQGKIQEKALIVSPGTGIPIEWSNPMILELPAIQYLPMGWLTFSPAYESVLKQFGNGFLPDELYQKTNVYLLTRQNIMFGVREFIREHAGIKVTTRMIYQMPNISAESTYNDLILYSFYQKGK